MTVVVVTPEYEFTCSADGSPCVTQRRTPERSLAHAIKEQEVACVLFVGLVTPDPLELICTLHRESCLQGFGIALLAAAHDLYPPVSVMSHSCSQLGRVSQRIMLPLDLEPKAEAEEFAIDIRAREIKVRGKRQIFSPLEFRILLLFLRYPEIIFSRRELLRRTRGNESAVDRRVVDVLIMSIRTKIERIVPGRSTSRRFPEWVTFFDPGERRCRTSCHSADLSSGRAVRTP